MTDRLVKLEWQGTVAIISLNQGLAHQVVEKNCDTAAMTRAEGVAEMQSGSICRSRRLLNTNIEELRYRLEAERVAFVTQVQ
jgi:hypothetical protein